MGLLKPQLSDAQDAQSPDVQGGQRRGGREPGARPKRGMGDGGGVMGDGGGPANCEWSGLAVGVEDANRGASTEKVGFRLIMSKKIIIL